MSKLFESLKEKMEEGNKQYKTSISTKKCGKCNESQQIIQLLWQLLVRRTIKAQPAAVSRRKSKFGSRQKQDTRFSNTYSENLNAYTISLKLL